MSQLIAPAVERGVRQLTTLKDDRNGVRGALRLGFQELVNAGVARIVSRGGVPAG